MDKETRTYKDGERVNFTSYADLEASLETGYLELVIGNHFWLIRKYEYSYYLDEGEVGKQPIYVNPVGAGMTGLAQLSPLVPLHLFCWYPLRTVSYEEMHATIDGMLRERIEG